MKALVEYLEIIKKFIKIFKGKKIQQDNKIINTAKIIAGDNILREKKLKLIEQVRTYLDKYKHTDRKHWITTETEEELRFTLNAVEDILEKKRDKTILLSAISTLIVENYFSLLRAKHYFPTVKNFVDHALRAWMELIKRNSKDCPFSYPNFISSARYYKNESGIEFNMKLIQLSTKKIKDKNKIKKKSRYINFIENNNQNKIELKKLKNNIHNLKGDTGRLSVRQSTCKDNINIEIIDYNYCLIQNCNRRNVGFRYIKALETHLIKYHKILNNTDNILQKIITQNKKNIRDEIQLSNENSLIQNLILNNIDMNFNDWNLNNISPVLVTTISYYFYYYWFWNKKDLLSIILTCKLFAKIFRAARHQIFLTFELKQYSIFNQTNSLLYFNNFTTNYTLIFGDIETTDKNSKTCKLAELYCIAPFINNNNNKKEFHKFVRLISSDFIKLQKINFPSLKYLELKCSFENTKAIDLKQLLIDFKNWILQFNNPILIFHNGNTFDSKVIIRSFEESLLIIPICNWDDSLKLFNNNQFLYPEKKKKEIGCGLNKLCNYYNIQNIKSHTAKSDTHALLNLIMLVGYNSIKKITNFFINELEQKKKKNFITCSVIDCKKKQNRLCIQLMCASHCRKTTINCKQHKK